MQQQRLVEIGEINSEFCPSVFSDKGDVGLLDQAIIAAQKKSKADFIADASFYRDSNGCISIIGTGKKITKNKL